MSNTWVLVAESSRAKIYSTSGGSDSLEEIVDLSHSESRLHEQELTADLPGSNAGGGSSHHKYEDQTDVKDQEDLRFAKQIEERLEKAWNKGEFNQLIVASAPAFLGVLRKIMNPNISKSVIREIDRNLTQFNSNELKEHLKLS